MAKLQTLKGFRDFLPDEARKRNYVIQTLRTVFERYNYLPLETPSLEYEEILTGKYGEEGDKLLYKFTDNGNRRVAMRYDQTVPLSRVIAQYQHTLSFPFKRYQIQNVWRAENTQKGRFREFLQCDIDIVGSSSFLADAEILSVIFEAYKKLGFKDFKILLNDRSLFKDLPTQAIIAIDKLKKIGKEAVEDELNKLGLPSNTLEEIMNISIPDSLQKIINTAKQFGVSEKALVFEPTLARGLDYYTGIIMEVELPEYSAGSVGGGGRYDNLIGMFSSKNIPAVGFAFGFDRIISAMDKQALFPPIFKPSILVTIFTKEYLERAIEVTNKLREKGISTELYLGDSSKIEKQLKHADHNEMSYAIIIGNEEYEKNLITLKNLKTHQQKILTLDQAIHEIL